jgi:molybdenum cofactor cytidylyltransferase
VVGALILAAGLGRRIGLGPKALLVLDGATFLEHCVRVCREAGCSPIRIVVRSGVPELLDSAASLADLVVLNPDPERGMFSSVQCGLKDVDLDVVTGFVLYPVDHPRVHRDTVARVAAGIFADSWVVPRFEGRSGHPIGIGVDVIKMLPALPDRFTLREALEHVAARRIDIDVLDPGVLENVNTL